MEAIYWDNLVYQSGLEITDTFLLHPAGKVNKGRQRMAIGTSAMQSGPG